MNDLRNSRVFSSFTSSKGLISFFLILCAIVAILHRISRSPFPPPAEKKKEEQYTITKGVVSKGKPLVLAMQSSGVNKFLIYQIVNVLDELADLKKCRPGEEFVLKEGEKGEFLEFQYFKDEKTIYKVLKEGEKFVSLKVELKIDKRVERIRGRVDRNLYDTILLLGENVKLVIDFVHIFSWEIDFAADVRNGDEFDILVEKEYIAGSFIGYGEILTARYKGYFGEKWAFLFQNGNLEDYYDMDGESLRRAIMRAPLSYTRISSKFSPKRLHPILKVWRPHYGVDYAAPRGTPVMAAGDGVVKFAGWKGHYGYYVRIKHPNGYQTGYGHLLRIAKGIRVGKRVKVKQVIGWVGSSGLSTGPHLQYEIIRRGKYLNPLRIKLPPVKSLDKSLFALFKEHIEHTMALLQNWDSLTIAERKKIFLKL